MCIGFPSHRAVVAAGVEPASLKGAKACAPRVCRFTKRAWVSVRDLGNAPS